ncbi:UDP-N-acetylmuramate--L-alanine ligase [Tessaracoccus sp. ZS01]|uniref:UDP-N-acetylmuramate--L-alanine ligase n=1 Tax=Tessaracoccus sp. ZS01 TaxID=1906324 RepID=UPI00096CA008|nr:UDP-N-acetylmuramate--L-alanine ligase [Tessaracoccus sp. ZS01]MCG6566182.1 UDP-N-acetylmuramate--L-alanine ligase [Tessaracoccus sp. ZS01]OMG58672.1 UDP-N-acetylmuramate--L-alanine ligase [Tessaracoccus sp. ZS01]
MLLNPIEVVPADQVGPVHFIAAGGSGMSGIARLYAELGIKTSGSDQSDSTALRGLQRAGVTTYVGHDASQVGDAKTVVISSAIRADNVELVEARRRGLRIWHRSAALAALMKGKRGVSVAGTHGKTTTTAMTAVMLSEAGRDPSYVIGGPLSTTGASSAVGAGESFVVEADESDASFLQYPTEIAVITNVEADHLVNWGTAEAYADGFRAFATRPHVQHVVINVDDAGSRMLADELVGETPHFIRYGESEDADVRITEVEAHGNGVAATITYGSDSGRIVLQVPGNHNLANASAAYAVGRVLGLSHGEAVDALGRFEGTLRRFQLITDTAGIRVFDDYAHHPTEIRAALTAARRATSAGNEATGLTGRLIACFQPHLYSRTLDFADEFGEVMTLADIAVINDICGAREDPVPGVTGELVVDAARKHGQENLVYVKEKYDLPAALNDIAEPGDLIITLGCGDVTIVGPLLADLLKQRPTAK